MSKGRLLLALPLFLILVSGCPKKSGTVGTLSGKVTYKGKEVTGGQMTFFTKEGGAVPATIKPDGTYSVRDLAVGEATVTVDTKNLKPANPAAVRGGGGDHKMQTGPVPPGFSQKPEGEYVEIPPKYADQKKTDLKVTVTGGPQTQDFELK